MKKPDASALLRHTLCALELELLAATDDEVLAAATELGLKPDMKGSIALAGVTQLVVRKPVGTDEHKGRGKSSRRRGATPRSPKT